MTPGRRKGRTLAKACGSLLLLLPFLPSCSSSPSAGGAGNGGASPELVLHGVTVRHTGGDGLGGTIEARGATYSLDDKVVVAQEVIVRFPSDKGDVRVDAPTADWSTERGVLRFPMGARATLGGDFRATLAKGEADLPSRLLRGIGEATLEGPGFSVSGNDLSWDLRAGQGGLSGPRARIVPGRLARRG